MTIQELQQQRRWVLWRMEPGKDSKPTKVPYQPNGYKASLLNPKHLHNDPLHDDCPRQYSILVRNGRSEHFWMGFIEGELRMVPKPEPKAEQVRAPKRTALQTMGLNCLFKFKHGDKIVYSPDLGSRATFFRWRDRALADGDLVRSDGEYYMSHAVSRESVQGPEIETNTHSVSVSV